MSDETPDTTTCPDCGTRNRPGSAFCAECGAMLPHQDTDADATASFTPVTTDEHTGDAWDHHPDDSQTTQLFTPRVEYGDTSADTLTASPWSQVVAVPGTTYVPEPGRRGFVLGLIASALILFVFGFFLWSTVASEGFRDAITGLF